MFHVGPYPFTETDALRTFGNAAAWWHEMTVGLETTDLTSIGDRIASTVAGLGPLTNEALGTWPEGRAESALTSVLGDLATAADLLRATGRIATIGSGTVAQLHRSTGGVPKTAVGRVEVGFGGVEGDVQKTRLHHGRPWQALCLWSTEVIASFAAEGHPVRPGGAGENITITGLPWASVRPGVRFRLGTVICEASLYALPCQKTAFNFTGGRFELMHHERGPVSRMYATVLEPGSIEVGDPIELSA